MRTLILTSCYILSISSVLFSNHCYAAAEIGSDFDRVLAATPKRQGWSGEVMFNDLKESAHALVTEYPGETMVPFLKARIINPAERKIAMLGLAKLATTDTSAKDALNELIYTRQYQIRWDALTAITYLPQEDALLMTKTLLAEPGPWEVRKRAAEMLVGLGDDSTLTFLTDIYKTEDNRIVKSAIESAIAHLEYRLENAPAEMRQIWAQHEIACWRTLQEAPCSRKTGSENVPAAQALLDQGWEFPREYLQYKIVSCDSLAVVVVGLRKEAWAIQFLKSHAGKPDTLGDFARLSLVSIGSVEALRALEDLLAPDIHKRAFTQIMTAMRNHGDEVSIESVEKLSNDKRFSDDERNSLKITYEIIKKRLTQKW